MFRRRRKGTYWARGKALVYPRGGFRRSAIYMWHRLRRLPDPPHRIARGVFAGTFVNFPPIFGLQFFAAAGLAWAMRGNVVAALLATLLSNPVTTPLIALVSLKLGHWMLGRTDSLSIRQVYDAFGGAAQDLWNNMLAMFGPATAHWDGLAQFWDQIYFPYLVGSIAPGLLVSLLFAGLTLPLVSGYQQLRRRRLKRKAAANRDDAARHNP